MTRFLSQSLNAKEPDFSHSLRRLENASGSKSIDIKFTLDVNQKTKQKINELGLDPDDTTAKELYHALMLKIEADDKKLLKNLRTLAATHTSAEADPIEGVKLALKQLSDNNRCFALKLSRLKDIIKLTQPKKTMKLLGYRSIDSMLKREHPVLILTGARMSESGSWNNKFSESYKKLKASDFEERDIGVLSCSSQRWQSFNNMVKAGGVVGFKELGMIVLLPLPKDIPGGYITALLYLALHNLNEIRACSSYLRLNQVKSNYGKYVLNFLEIEPQLSVKPFEHKISWSIVHKYLSKLQKNLEGDFIDPYLRLEDLLYNPIEKSLAAIEPSLNFWKNTAFLGIISEECGAVSLNILDNALNLCNKLDFYDQVKTYYQNSLWHELMLRYIKSQNAVEESLIDNLQPWASKVKEIVSI